MADIFRITFPFFRCSHSCIWYIKEYFSNRKLNIRIRIRQIMSPIFEILLNAAYSVEYERFTSRCEKVFRFDLHLIVSRFSYDCIARGSCHKMLPCFHSNLTSIVFTRSFNKPFSSWKKMEFYDTRTTTATATMFATKWQ